MENQLESIIPTSTPNSGRVCAIGTVWVSPSFGYPPPPLAKIKATFLLLLSFESFAPLSFTAWPKSTKHVGLLVGSKSLRQPDKYLILAIWRRLLHGPSRGPILKIYKNLGPANLGGDGSDKRQALAISGILATSSGSQATRGKQDAIMMTNEDW